MPRSHLMMTLTCLAAGAMGGQPPDIQGAIAAIRGPNALAEWHGGRTLVAAGDAAVPALEKLAGAPGPLAPRLIAVELLGEIGSRAAMNALIGTLEGEKDLTVRGQICMQLGKAREKRAVPVLCEWLKTIRPGALNDRGAPKESEPSTCYCRHLEALGMIGDEQAIPAIEEFLRQIPRSGAVGFLANFVTGAAQGAIQDIRDAVAVSGNHQGGER